jgi:hypothetical protein
MYQRLRPVRAFSFDANQNVLLLYAQSGSKRAEDDGGLHDYANRDTFFIRLTYFLA